MNLGYLPFGYPKKLKGKLILSLFTLLLIGQSVKLQAQEALNPAYMPDVRYHLTARPWEPLNTSRTKYLDKVEEIVRQIVKYQNLSGAIIDPYAKTEIQYSTPYFANAVGTLISAGRALDLLANGILAMNSATLDIAQGSDSIPDNHGEFFIAPLTSAIPLYTSHVSDELISLWQKRLATPIEDIIRNRDHNWRTYAMKGEWLRAKSGYVDKANALSWIEDSWKTSQKPRFQSNSLNFYHDETSDPDSWPYESAARGNLLAMLAEGYPGASASEMSDILQDASKNSLLLQDPTGQGIAGGRSGNHTWNDIVLANSYETLAEIMNNKGETRLAGQFRRAAALGFKSALRFQRDDGTFSVTKNHFDPKLEVRYAGYSHFTNYNGYMMFHMSENFLRHKSSIAEQPAPNEIGGYTIVTDRTMATAGANAGGMAMQATLRGSTELTYDLYWSTLGVVRFSRSGWDSRLGPSDGVRETASKLGVSFAPEFLENGSWVRLASMPDRYEAFFTTQFTHPLLVKCRIVYKPKAGQSGPTFTNDFVVTPDGILSTLKSNGGDFGVTWPILTFDGESTLVNNFTNTIASTSFNSKGDEQNFIALNSAPTVNTSAPALRSSYGDLKPVRMTSNTDDNVSFIYPRNASDPSAESVRKSFSRSGDNFKSLLGTVEGNTYVGRTSAGGVSKSLDVNNDGIDDITFSDTCGFVLQLSNGKIFKAETNKVVTAVVYGNSYTLTGYTPADIDTTKKEDIKLVLKSSLDGSKVKLSWSGAGTDLQYTLQRSENGSAFFTIADNISATSYTDSKTSGGSSYCYQASIFTNGIKTDSSALSCVTVPETDNLEKLLIKSASASADEGNGNVAANTIDSDLATRWSVFGDNQSVQYDLGQADSIQKIKIAWYRGDERIASFDIYTSKNGTDWTKLFSGKSSGTNIGFEPYVVDTTIARYVKIVCHGTTLHMWNAISEVEIRGHEINSSPDPQPIVTKLPVYAVIGSADEDKVDHLIDGDKTTRWAATGDTNFVAADLGGLDYVQQLKVAWYRGDERITSFDIETSVDGIKWINVFSGKSSGKTLDFETYTLTAGNARYARIIGHGTNIDDWSAINEIEFYGSIVQKRRAYTTLPVKAITASADEGNGNVAANAIDKIFYTRWSVFGNGQTLTLDMGAMDTIKSLNIAWYRGYRRTMNFDIQSSEDKINWTTIYSGKSSGSAVFFEKVTVQQTVAAFVRVVCHGSNLNFWNAINEIEVFGTSPTSQFKKLEISKVSSLTNDGNVAANAIDSNLETRWSAINIGQSIQFTLKNPDTIKLVKIAWYKGDLRTADFLIQVSSDTLNWKTVYTGTSSGTTNSLQTVDIPDIAIKYLRIVGLGNSMNTWNSITEVELWGNTSPVNSNGLLTTFANSEQFELSNQDKLSAKPHLPGKNLADSKMSNEFVLWPNPNKGLFSIKTDLNFWKGAGLSIYSSTGKIMFNRKINQSITTVDLTRKAKGLYFIKVKKGVDELNSKIITE